MTQSCGGARVNGGSGDYCYQVPNSFGLRYSCRAGGTVAAHVCRGGCGGGQCLPDPVGAAALNLTRVLGLNGPAPACFARPPLPGLADAPTGLRCLCA